MSYIVNPEKTLLLSPNYTKERVIPYLKKSYGLDLRSLSFLRIAVGLTIMIDLLIRFTNLEAHYTDNGILPLSALFTYSWNKAYFSLYTIATSYSLQLVIFAINFICALCLMVGFRTKIFTIICFIFLLSLHNRNPLIHQGGDDLLRLLLFWSIFLPWGNRYSMDSLKNNNISKDTNYFSWAGIGLILQIIYVYFFSALLKSSPEWFPECSALYYALSIDQIALPLGKIIYPYYSFLKIMTGGVYLMELTLPFVLLIPIWVPQLRVIFIATIFLLHLGISLCLNVGLFPLIGAIALIALLPQLKIEWLEGRKVFKTFSQFVKRLLSKFEVEGSEDKPKEGRVKSLFMIVFILYIFLWNLETIGKSKIITQNNLNNIAYFLRIDQFWGMFSPGVFKDDGWFVFAAESEKGKKINILNNGEDVLFNTPAYTAGPFKEDRWRKYSENFLSISNSHYRPYYCHYLLNNWNNNHDEKIKKVEIFYMKEKTLPNYLKAAPVKELLCDCFQ